MRSILPSLFLIALLAGCTSSKYGVTAPMPTLKIDVPEQSYQVGKPFTLSLAASQEGVEGSFFLSAVVLAGKASMSLDGTELAGDGGWIVLPQNPAKLSVTPAAAGELALSLQIRSAAGTVSEKQMFLGSIRPNSGFSVTAECESEIINPTQDTQIPIHLLIDNPQYTGNYTVTAKLESGQGAFYANGFVVSNTEFALPDSGIVEFQPSALGEQIIEFTIKAGTNTVKTRVYTDVIKRISVQSEVTDCFSTSGPGSYNTEGMEIAFALIGNEEYNFQVEGWYDQAGKRLSSDSCFMMTLSYNSPVELQLKLRKRTVQIQRNGTADVEFKYKVLINGQWVDRSVYDCKTSLSANLKASDELRFHYAKLKYDTSLNPPEQHPAFSWVELAKGDDWAGYFWQCNGEFDISIRKSDNPDLTLSATRHTAESKSTIYLLPVSISVQ